MSTTGCRVNWQPRSLGGNRGIKLFGLGGQKQGNGPSSTAFTSRMALIRSAVDRLDSAYELLRVRCGSRGWAAGASSAEGTVGCGAMAGLVSAATVNLDRQLGSLVPQWRFGSEMPRAAKVGKRACTRAIGGAGGRARSL